MSQPKNTERETNGRYMTNKFDTLCRCGHTLGHHLAASPKACIEGDFGHERCDCECFKKARKIKEQT